ncbi:MAG: SGNH/GDSL hydrolase family protein [Clostridia bacterium]|nr:SGNH/GDSL hydrolase family protein [Clostridia bacterium]
MDIEKNDVPASKQVQEKNYIEVFNRGGTVNVLFIGNSITRHEPKPEIGWEHDWGMAASEKQKDYVHVAVKLLDEKFGKINYCIANCGEWELHYYDDGILQRWKKARDFRADILVIRIGENIYGAREQFDANPIAPHYAKMVEFFSANPNVKVVVTDLFWTSERIDGAICKVAEEKGYTLVRLNDLGEKDENKALGKFWHGGVAAHPNDEGMRQIAERIVQAL